MARFRVKAAALDGRVISMEMEAWSAGEIASRLDKDGLFPIEVRPRGLSSLSFKTSSRVKTADLLVFNQGLATLLKAGLPLVEALDTLRASSQNRQLSEVISKLIDELKGGQTLSGALEEHPGVFSALYAATIAAGERTGDLIPSLYGYIAFQKRVEEIRKKVVFSATYPLILAGASLLVVSFLLTYVVPTFAKIYLDAGSELPFATRLLITFSGIIRDHILLGAAACVAAFFSIRWYFRKQEGRYFLDRIKLRIPQIGEIYRGYSLSKFSRTMAMLLKSGMPLPEALRMSAGVLDNSVLERKLECVIKEVVEGGSASGAIEKAGLMPAITMRMFSVGERSASLQPMLEEIADFHDSEVEHKVQIVTNLIEPALMVVMGLVIGAIVVLMYMPIFQLGARIQP